MTRIERPFDITRLEDEWLEADGFGGFASGTVGTLRTRRYHALLLTATRAPGGRVVLVNGVEAWLEADGQRYPLSMQRYVPDVIYPDLTASLLAFDTDPWPTWRLQLDPQKTLIAEVFVSKATRETVLRWRLEGSEAASGAGAFTLKVRPLLSGRDYHALHHENSAFNFNVQTSSDQACTSWQPYGDLPVVNAATNGVYAHAPDWYRNFCYVRERERGLDFSEDLATPGVFSFNLADGEAVMILSASIACSASVSEPSSVSASEPAGRKAVADYAAESAGTGNRVTKPAGVNLAPHATELANIEQQRRSALGSRLQRSADAYLVARNEGRTILAGFPWFTDWGRDTFIAMRGLLIATGRLDEAEAILLEWSRTLSEGMLPNRFPDYGDTPEYNSVDASLWFVVAVHDYLATNHAKAGTRTRLQQAVEIILTGYTNGTRFNIKASTDDGLLSAGVPGVQLTWMDAKVGDWVVTPRIGKPVEVQALWINALRIAATWNRQWQQPADRALQAFHERFTDPSTQTLVDNVDMDFVKGVVDRSIRPNQIFAVGGLPFPLLEDAAARAVVDQVEAHLLTPLGLRTLAPSDPAYRGHYGGTPLERDGAYHQGTVWPWLLGPFVEAWLRVHGAEPDARTQAKARFLDPLYAHLDHAGLDHLSEIADGDAPHTPAGTPFQAWSLGELLRIENLLARLESIAP
ncbi:amylo-alpha-1,6-glucosidase [Paraburkholderia madseniana]|uniref:Amylo-alpha-1,6-glucosidase n=1 Tax=Paraburkholderia madseniana TaxID=2599607 RepID=A0AAP5B7B7_9BURK|nr:MULTISPECIES: amylo-alpha-1,6-glucosidase [Paraburkholderia]MCX4144200.1 glycogen debranching enzyme N-terminal domain-containing protein [Paraburkholderia madseniana]MDN7147153.1 amylo-alpha-1,6-glucosidase [Paraburkholderia sp. WS6]MDQ6406033.1 amylo-alpha-1,6-glucosidase [Paraburkholderia madseniana]